MPLQVPMAELLRLAQESRAGDIWTCFPATVQAYTASPAPVADLVPVVQRPLTSAADDSLDFEQLPVLPDVPILFPQGSGGLYAITWPLAAGDGVLVLVSTYSFAEWYATGKSSTPTDIRPHHLANCVAIPGFAPSTAAPASAQQGALVLTAPTVLLGGMGASDFVALASKCDKNFSDIASTLASALIAPPNGGPVTGGSSYTPTAVAASQVKAL